MRRSVNEEPAINLDEYGSDEPIEPDYVLDIDEEDIIIKPTRKDIEAIVLTHIDYDVSISALCKSLECSRDLYYSIKRKAGRKSGSVDYKQLVERAKRTKFANVRRAERAKRVEIASLPDEEW